MTRLSQLTPVDGRSDWEKISRRQYWKGLKRLNVPCPSGATQSQMINISQTAGLTPDQVANFVPVQVNTADGNGKVVLVPEDHERKYDEKKELRRAEEMERRIEAGVKQEETRISAEKQKMEAEKNVEIQGLKTELEDLKEMMQKLLTQGTEQNVPHETVKSVKKITDPKEIDPNRNQYMYEDRKRGRTYNQLSEKYGLSGPRCRQIIKKLEAQDGKDTSDGS